MRTLLFVTVLAALAAVLVGVRFAQSSDEPTPQESARAPSATIDPRQGSLATLRAADDLTATMRPGASFAITACQVGSRCDGDHIHPGHDLSIAVDDGHHRLNQGLPTLQGSAVGKIWGPTAPANMSVRCQAKPRQALTMELVEAVPGTVPTHTAPVSEP